MLIDLFKFLAYMAISLAKNLFKNVFLLSLSAFMFLTFFSSKASAQSTDICSYDAPENPYYKASVIQIRQKKFLQTTEKASVKVILKNEGNTPWFSDSSPCGEKNATFLGTTRQQDRQSDFYDSTSGSGWQSPTRIFMQELRVNPGELATFKFELNSHNEADFYREYFTPLVDGVTWMDESLIPMDIQVGSMTESSENIKAKRELFYYSDSSNDFNLDGEHSLVIDLSKQKMWARVGDTIVKEMTTSSGAHDHATPQGNLKIAFKERIRIGGKSPHYIMPYFIGLEWDNHKFNGYGIHHYPAYGNATMRAEIKKRKVEGIDYFQDIYADDWMWKNAHYDMGKPVSHGCVRTDLAPFVYSFMEVGDRVYIYGSLDENLLASGELPPLS